MSIPLFLDPILLSSILIWPKNNRNPITIQQYSFQESFIKICKLSQNKASKQADGQIFFCFGPNPLKRTEAHSICNFKVLSKNFPFLLYILNFPKGKQLKIIIFHQLMFLLNSIYLHECEIYKYITKHFVVMYIFYTLRQNLPK